MKNRGNILVSVLLGLGVALLVGATTDQILQSVYDSTNTALRANIVVGGGITSGSTTITGGTDTDICFDDAGVINCNSNALNYTKGTGRLGATRFTLGSPSVTTDLVDMAGASANRQRLEDTATAVASAGIYQLDVYGNNDAAALKQFFRLQVVTDVVTAASENGLMSILLQRNGGGAIGTMDLFNDSSNRPVIAMPSKSATSAGLRRSTTHLQSVLGDSSGFSFFDASSFTLSGAATTANRYIKAGSTTGFDTQSSLAAGGIGSCTNQVVTALNADAAPTCSSVTSAMQSFTSLTFSQQEVTTGIVTDVNSATVASTTRIVRCNKGTAMTETLPTSGMVVGQRLDVKNIGAGACTVDSGSAHTIDAAQTYVLSAQYQSVSLLCTAISSGVCTAWDIL